jgi:uncharacterized protein
MIQETGFVADGLRLKGTLHLPAEPHPPCVIGCHGLLSDRHSPKQVALAKACNRLGLAYFRFDHRGCGESEGRLEEVTSLKSRSSDVIHGIRHLLKHLDLAPRIGLFGSSMGGSVCLEVAARFEVAVLVTFAAPVRSRPLRAGLPTPGRVRMHSVLREEFDLVPNLGRVHNILVIHGEADDVVPVSHASEIFQASKEPKRLIIQKNGDHLMSAQQHQDEFIAEASKWLKKGLTP